MKMTTSKPKISLKFKLLAAQKAITKTCNCKKSQKFNQSMKWIDFGQSQDSSVVSDGHSIVQCSLQSQSVQVFMCF